MIFDLLTAKSFFFATWQRTSKFYFKVLNMLMKVPG